MTSDSDDVADTADQKPKGSLKQQGPAQAPSSDDSTSSDTDDPTTGKARPEE